MSCRKTWCVVLTSLSVLAWLTPGLAQTRNRMDLRNNWLLQSSCKANTPAEVLSTAQFSPDQWYKTTVPSTVLAAQVANGEFKDIYFGDNLRKLPGSAEEILELAQGAHSLYLTLNDPERAQLVRTVVSNCLTDGVSITPTYRKPFEIIFQRGQNQEWRRERDSNPRYP